MKKVDRTESAVDPEARATLAELMKGFLAGDLTNFQFEARQQNSRDKTVRHISYYAWFLYDDFREEIISYDIKTDGQVRDQVARCIEFLHSSFLYKYPYGPEALYPHEPRSTWAHFATLGLTFAEDAARRSLFQRRKRMMEAAGDITAWPFLSHADRQTAKGFSSAE